MVYHGFWLVYMVLLVENTTKLYPGPTIQFRPCRPKAGFGVVMMMMMMMMTTMMIVMAGTSGVMQRLQCHGRKRSSQLFNRETETDGYNYHKIPHQMKMLMIIILCCIVITTSIITKVKVTTSHVLVMNRTQGSNLYFCYCAPSQYYSCN